MSFERTLTHEGETLKISEWAERTGLKYNTIIMRIQMGWTTEKVLNKITRNWKSPKLEKQKEEKEEFLKVSNHKATIFDTEYGDYGKF